MFYFPRCIVNGIVNSRSGEVCYNPRPDTILAERDEVLLLAPAMVRTHQPMQTRLSWHTAIPERCFVKRAVV